MAKTLRTLIGSIFRRRGKLFTRDAASLSLQADGATESHPVAAGRFPYQLFGGDEAQVFRSVLKKSPTVIYAHDRDLRYVWVYNLRDGYREPDVLGRTDRDLLPAKYAEPITGLKRKVLESGRGDRQAVQVNPASSDETRFYDLSVEPLLDKQGNVAGLACAATDITDQKLAEERERTQRLLAESMVRITTLLNRSLGLDHNLYEVLGEMERVIPYSAANFVIAQTEAARVVSAREAPGIDPLIATDTFDLEANAVLKAIRETGQPLVSEAVDNSPEWSGDAFAGWVRSYAGLPIHVDGTVVGFLNVGHESPQTFLPAYVRYLEGVANKVSLAIRNAILVTDLQKALERTRRADDLRMTLLSTVSHEMRTPLASIKGFTTTLLAEDVTWDEASERRFLVNIDEEVDKLNELVSQLLDYSRLEAGQLPIRRNQAGMAAIIADVLSQLQIPLAEYRVRVDCPADLPPVYADDRRIAQVLGNLLRNIIKYVPKQTDIRIDVSERGETVVTAVSDQGAGIPPEQQDQVFVPFKRGQAERALQGGAGLGLAISKRIIEAHGGEIWLEEQDKAGATFAFSLPVYSASQIPPDEPPGTA